jgi:photosystem II stability/assembly factor-like uncharacterized protein
VLRTQPVNVTIVASAVNFDPGTTSIAVQDSGNTNQVPLGTPAWQSEGPAPIIGGRTTNVATSAGAVTNPVTGPIAAVLAPPASANLPNVLFVGAVNGGVWKTTNANDPNGPTWTPLTDSMPSLSISSLQFGTTNGLVDPTKLIAGVGHSSDFADQGGTLAGLLVSTTSGASWSPVTPSAASLATPVGQNITGVAERDNVILAAVNNTASGNSGIGGATSQLLRSTDGGQTFVFMPTSSGLPAGPISDLVGDPIDPKRFYAAVLGTNGGIFTSDDSGGTWTDVTPSVLRTAGALQLNATPDNDTIRIADNGQAVYFGYEKFGAFVPGQTDLVGIFRSPATALTSSTWVQMDRPTTTNQNGTTYGLNPEGGSDSNVPTATPIVHFSIAADPSNPNLVYVGGDSLNVFPNSVGSVDLTGRLFRGNASLPAGSQFTPITDNYTANHSAPHSDSRAMTFLGSQLVEADDGGVYTLTNPSGSNGVWTSLVGNLDVSEMYSAAYDTNTNTLVGATQDTGTAEQQAAGGGVWTEVNKNNGGVVAVDDITLANATNPALSRSIRYTSSPQLGELNGNNDFIASTYDANNNLVASTKPALSIPATGQTLYQAEPNLPYVTTLALNAVNPKQMVIGGANSVYESLDGGQTLTSLGIGGVGANQLFGAAMAYGGYLNGVANAGVLWVGSGNQVFLRTSGVGALTATSYSTTNFNPGTGNISTGAVRALAIDPNDWQIAVVADNNGQVWYTTNGGQSFTNITANLLGLNGKAADLHSLAFVPSETTSLIYVGTQDGVYQYQTANQTAGWSRYGASLPDVPVFSLEYVPGQQLLVAGTLGRGAFIISAVGNAGDVSITLNQQTVSDDFVAASGDGLITGTVTRSGTFGDLPVVIKSSNPAVVPNTTVTIPDGQSTFDFSIPVTDELDASGNEIAIPRQTVILTPQAGGLNPVGAFVNISDDNEPTNDDTPALTVTLPTREMNPAQGSTQITGTVSVNFPVTQDLTVTLLSSDPQRGSVVQANGTNTVVIKAGTTSTTFTLTAVDQFINDGQPQWVTVTAAAVTSQGLSVTSDPGDGNDIESDQRNANAETADSDDTFTVKIEATQHLLSYNRVGDASVPRPQGQTVIQDARISNSLDYAIVAEPAPRSGVGATPSPGVPINFQPLNTDRVAPGVTITSNLLVGNGQGGINLVGDTGNSPASAVPIARVLNNTIYGGSAQTGVGVNVGAGVSPTILNNIFANLATGVNVDPTSTSTVLEGSVYQNNGADLTGAVANGGDLLSYHLQPTDPLFTNAATGDFYLAKGSVAIDSAINQLNQRADLTTAESLIGIPASPTVAPAYDLYGQLRTGDVETNPSGVGSTLFKDRGAIERVDFTGPTATLVNPAANGAANLSASLTTVHWIGGPLKNFAIQLGDVGVGVDDSTVTSSAFALYRNAVKLTAGVDYFFQYDTNTKTVYLVPATGVWAAGNQYTIFIDNGVDFDAFGSGTQGGIKDLAGNDLQANRGTGSVDAGFTQFDILLQSPSSDAPTVGVPLNQTVPENGFVATSLTFSSLNTPPNPITLFNIDAPGDVVTAVFSTTNGTLSVAGIAGNGSSSMIFGDGGTVTITGSGSSTLTLTGTVADITQVLSGAAAQGGSPAIAGLTFVPTVDYNGPASITISVTDPLLGNGGLTGTGVVNIQVTAVNQPPIINVPAGQSVVENSPNPLVFSAATGNAITITDPDDNGGVETVTINTLNQAGVVTGTVTLTPVAGITYSQGNGIADSQLTFSGTLQNINAALDGMQFVPAANFSQTAVINFSVNDNGNSLGVSSGGANIIGTPATGTAKEFIAVVHQNQPPNLIKPIPPVVVPEISQTRVVQIDLSQYIGDPDENAVPPQPAPTLTVFGNLNPRLVTATINGQILTLTIPAYASGNATIAIEATDNDGATLQPPAQLNVVVNPQPFPPTANDDQYRIPYPVPPGFVLSVDAAAGVLANDVDHNGEALTASVSGQVPAEGRLVFQSDGSFVYTPDALPNPPFKDGQDSFQYHLMDSSYGANHPNPVLGTAYFDTPNGLYIVQLYTQVLGRTTHPSDAEVNYWVGLIDQGVSIGQIAYTFVHSPEYFATNVIQPAYLRLLGRPADAEGIAFWTAKMQNGLTDQALEAGFVASDEFYADAGGTNTAWINAVYEKLLGRAPDSAGQSYWLGQLGSGVSRGQVALLIANSAENDSQLINADYQKFLGRAADPNGLSFWLKQFADGQTNEDVVAGFTGSEEYYKDHS